MATANLQMIAVMDRAQLKALKEQAFSVAVREFAEAHNWKCHYTKTTGYMGSGGKWRSMAPSGWPDLFLARDGKAISAELKREVGGKAGEPTAEQQEWLEALGAVEGVSAVLWKPSMAVEIMEALR